MHKRIVWEAERCPQAGPVSIFFVTKFQSLSKQNNENKSLDESKLLLEDFKNSIAELEMDELYSVDQSSGRKDDSWTAITMTGMDFGKF